MAYHKSSHLPSVTQVIAPFTDYSRIPPHILAQASERGSRVHGICAARVQGLWHPPVGDDLAGYIRSFDAWALVVADLVLAEAELVDAALGYAGHPDLILRVHGDEGLSLVDLKTPVALHWVWRAQLAAYRNLAEVNGHQISRVFSLRLAKDGGQAKLDEYTGTTRADFAGFIAALNAYRYFKGEK
jgi:hypothetical protein